MEIQRQLHKKWVCLISKLKNLIEKPAVGENFRFSFFFGSLFRLYWAGSYFLRRSVDVRFSIFFGRRALPIPYQAEWFLFLSVLILYDFLCLGYRGNYSPYRSYFFQVIYSNIAYMGQTPNSQSYKIYLTQGFSPNFASNINPFQSNVTFSGGIEL